MSIPIKISGSRSSAVLGMSPYQTQVSSWLSIMEEISPGFCKKNNYKLPEFVENSAVKWGSNFENEIINIVEKTKNIKIKNREKLFLVNDYISCHVDGISNDILIENKTTSQFYFKDNFGEPGTDQIPIHYQLQVQHNMFCTGLEKCMMVVLIFPKRPEDYENEEIKIESIKKKQWVNVLNEMGCVKFYEITANPYLQDLMIKHYTEFWNENVLKEMPPEPKSYDDIKALIREPVGTIVADEFIEHVMNEYKQIKQETSSSGPLAKRAEEIKVLVLEYMNGTDKVLDDDTHDKWILRDRAGKKIVGYGKNKNGNFVFR